MYPKPATCVSNALRNLAKGQDCTLRMPWCNHNNETVVLCHVRTKGLNGMACKPPDFIAYHGCSECHRREQDAGHDDIARAVFETLIRAYEAGIISVK